MSGVDQVAGRFHDALLGGVIVVVVTAFGSMWGAIGTPETISTSTEVSFTLFVALFQSAPGLLTLAGVAIASYRAGPFGLIGAVMEVVGVNRLFDVAQDRGLGLVIFGAVLVTVSSFFPWPQIYRELLS